jgi:DTW domain-containing protein
MRSHTHDDLPGRCRRCWLREAFCLCGDLPALSPKVGVLVVRHVNEGRKSTNTARIAALALGDYASEHLFTDDPVATNESLPDLSGAWLVYPGEGFMVSPETPAPSRLVFVDGTWRQSRRMVKKLTRLHALPRLALPLTTAGAVMRLRTTAVEGARSTLEAIADAYAVIGEADVAQALSRLSTLYVERVLKARGVWEQKVAQFRA